MNQDSIGRLSAFLGVFWAVLLVFSLSGCSQPEASLVAEPVIIQGQELVVWQACQDELRSRGFTIDRAERRSGEVATLSRTSSQWFEFWGRDLATSHDLAESSLHTTRRQVCVWVEPISQDRYQVSCRVMVERFAPENSSVGGEVYVGDVLTRAAGGRNRTGADPESQPNQWNSLGQDPALEKEILESIVSRVNMNQ